MPKAATLKQAKIEAERAIAKRRAAVGSKPRPPIKLKPSDRKPGP